jgi:hypothetical protein
MAPAASRVFKAVSGAVRLDQAARGSAGYVSRFGAASAASAIANAATRSLIEGSDFGDNVLAALPDVIGQTIGATAPVTP